VAIVAAVVAVMAVMAGNQARIATSGLMIFAVVVLHNGLGLLLGYWLGKLTGMEVSKRKALSIDVGMQNSGLGVALAQAHFSPWRPCPARSSACGTASRARWWPRCSSAFATRTMPAHRASRSDSGAGGHHYQFNSCLRFIHKR
jgi:BASS family bile acid:Na+ symporter